MIRDKQIKRVRIKKKIRGKISGTGQKPRLSVFRSNKDIYAQVIDDERGITLASASSTIDAIKGGKVTKVEKSFLVGKELATKALEAGISEVVFDRNGYLYHGRVKRLAEGAREGGLKF